MRCPRHLPIRGAARLQTPAVIPDLRPAQSRVSNIIGRTGRSGRLWGVALLVGAAAGTVVAIATAPPGPGLDPDTASYVGAGISLVRFGTYRVPMGSWTTADTTEPLTHFPPGFSTVVAAPIALGMPPIQAGRLIIVLAAAVTWSVLVALLIRETTTGVAVLIGVVILCTPAILSVHLSILSEPPFLAALVGVVAGMSAMSRSTKLWPALWTGLAAAAAVMLRYVGVSLALAAGWWAIMGIRRRRIAARDRIRAATLVVVPSGVTLGAWLLRSVRLEGVQGVRTLGAYGDLGGAVRAAASTIVSWVVPVGAGGWRYGVTAVIVAGAVAIIRGTRPRTAGDAGVADTDDAAGPPTEWVLVPLVTTLAIAYLGFVFAARLVADPDIPFDERILAPLFLLIEIAAGLVVADWWRAQSRHSRLVVGAVLLVWWGMSAGVTVVRIVQALQDGNDFAGSDWRDSPTIAWVRSDTGGDHRPLYTNWPAALYFQAQRGSHDLPATVDGLTLHRLRERLAFTHGVVVGFTVQNPDIAPPDTIARLMGLREVARFGDGAVWEEQGDSGIGDRGSGRN
jgi:hypothetical protein